MLGHVQFFVTPRTVACQVPLSMEFSRQEYWSGLPFPSPGDLPDPEIEPVYLGSPALAGRFFTIELPRKPKYVCMYTHTHTHTHTHTYTYTHVKASLVAQMVKNLPARQETKVQSLDQEDPLEKGMATHFSILAWKIPCTEEPGGLQSMRSQRDGHD